jgi:hypothetical protein
VSFVGQRHSGSATGLTVLDGNGATLDGSAPVPIAAWEHFRADVFRFRPGRVANQQLFLEGRPLLRVPTTPGSMIIPQLESFEWCLAGGFVYFCAGADRTPRDYALSYAALPTGVTFYHVRGVAVGNLTVQGFAIDGLQCHDAYNISLVSITARGNGRSGIAITASSRARIEDCLLGDNGAAQLHIEGYSQTRVSNSDLLDNTAPAYLLLGGKLYFDSERVFPSDDTAP